MKKYRLLVFGFFFLAVVNYSSAQEEVPEMVTDRPDATDSPTLVPVSYLQVETGFLQEQEGEKDFRQLSTSYNNTLVRYGLLESLELRLGINFGRDKISHNGTTISKSNAGLGPLMAGAKIKIAEEKGWLPKMALMGHVYLPFTAAKQYKPETTGVDFKFSFSHTLSEKSSLAYNIGNQWRNDSPEANYLYSISYGYSFTSAFGAFLEIYGNLPEDNTATHYSDTGLTYKFTENIQLDVLFGLGLNTDNYTMFGGGLSVRLPN